VVDIAERRQAEDALRQSEQRSHELTEELEQMIRRRTADLLRLNRTLKRITDCSKTIARASSEEELLKSICRLIVEAGGYGVAWVGFAEPDGSETFRLPGRARKRFAWIPVKPVGLRRGFLQAGRCRRRTLPPIAAFRTIPDFPCASRTTALRMRFLHRPASHERRGCVRDSDHVQLAGRPIPPGSDSSAGGVGG
jgi:hypothetical protein